MTDININLIRAGDKITLKNGNKFEIKETWNINDIFQVKVDHEGKEIILSYSITGKSLEPGKGLDIVEFEMVEKPEDIITYYIPKFDVNLLPILNLNGEDRLIYRLLDLDGLEVKGDQVLKASYKYVIEACLQKIKGRTTEIIKEEKIICESKETCTQKLEEIDKSIKGVDNGNKEEVSNLFKELIKKVG